MTALLDMLVIAMLVLILFGLNSLQSWLERWDRERHFED